MSSTTKKKHEDTVSAVMTRRVHSLGPDASAREALDLMIKNDIGSILVMDGSKIAGMLTEKDVVKKVAENGATNLKTPVGRIATKSVVTVAPDTEIWEAFTIMLKRKIRRLPVVDEGKVAGIVTERDLFKWIVRVFYEPNIPEDLRKLVA